MKVNRLLCIASLVCVFGASHALADLTSLPMRETPIPKTTDGVPHIQIGVEPVPGMSEALLKRVSGLPGVQIKPTVVSLPGALGFWISEDLALARPEVIVGGREFAHIHPDGSLHASLSPALAEMATERGWAVSHPWADQRPGWDGFVMIFTPMNTAELDVVFDLVEASYGFVKGLGSSPN